MGPVNRREREKEKLKKQILDAARYLFARDGYDSVTMRAIAERIEYSPRTLYLHFQDKEVLIRELCRNDFSEFGKGFAKLATVKDPIQRLKALVWPMRGLARISPTTTGSCSCPRPRITKAKARRNGRAIPK